MFVNQPDKQVRREHGRPGPHGFHGVLLFQRTTLSTLLSFGCGSLRYGD